MTVTRVDAILGTAGLAKQGGGVDDGSYQAAPQSEKENFQGLKVVRGGQVAPLD